ncbi:TonB family protein [Pontibacter sp. H259]|uniref:TonB family protein n=1 Tax=Pontibacter sp. H259 TaxID=3133421 RepID=UPI0030BE6114
MKTLFTLFLTFILCFQANAQLADSVNYKPVVIFYNARWEVTKKEHAAYTRIAYLPERLKAIQKPNRPAFNGPVRDYFADGNLWATGSYNKGQKWGQWSFYYPNGQLDCRGEFDGIWPKGKWQFWYPDGKLLMEATFDKANMYLHNFWNEAGEQTIKEGAGRYTIIMQDENGREMKMEGAVLNGKQTGVWAYGPVGGQAEMTQDLSTNPSPVKGRVILGNTNRFNINPVPDYLDNLEDWRPDNKVYEAKYPLIADVMKSEVQRIDIQEKKNATSDHYFRILQRFNASIDTLEYDIPIIHSDLSNMPSYIQRNFRFPAGLKGQSIKGTMLISFAIKTDGSIANVKIVKGLEPALDKEVVKLFEKAPKQKPTTLYTGKPIESNYTFPLRLDVRSSSIESEYGDTDNRSTGGRMVVPGRGYY